MGENNSGSFFRSQGGRILLAVILYALFLGLIVLLISIDAGPFTLLAGLPCIFFGWKALTSIQPAMFVWMSFMGWIIYFLVKLFLSLIVGVFIMPYKLSAAILSWI